MKKLLLISIFVLLLYQWWNPWYPQKLIAQTPIQITFETSPVSDFVWSPDGSQFAYIALYNDTTRLYKVDIDESNKMELCSNAYGRIDWKDNVIVFMSYDPAVPSYNNLIKKINPDGSGISTITGPYWYTGVYLRADANWILYRRAPGGWWRAMRCDIEGNNVLEVSHNYLVQQVGWFGTNQILYSRGSNYYTTCGIYKVNFDGSGYIPLTPENLPNNSTFIASPDMSKILYCDGTGNNWDIWIMDADGNNKTQLTVDPSRDYLSNTRDNIWSTDGQSFYFVSDRTGNGDIYQLNVDGTGLTQITTHDSLDYIPIPSPDGTKLAFISRRSGVDNIWLINFGSSPGLATNPDPPDGAVSINVNDLVLSWDNPPEATSNEVYFGTDPGSLTLMHSGSLVNSINAPSPLLNSTTYYWQVNEINSNGTTIGTIWNFSTISEPAILPYEQTFNETEFPEYWTQTIEGGVPYNSWGINTTNWAGGTPNEALAQFSYGVGISRLILGPIYSSGLTGLLLDFRNYFDDFGTGCNFKIQSSTDAITWTNEIFEFSSGGGNIGPEYINTFISNNVGTTTYIAWVIDGDHNSFDFWCIDDILIKPLIMNDVGTFSIDVPSNITTGLISPQATVINIGTNTQTFDVEMTIGSYSSTKTVTGLASLATEQVTFDDWNATPGSYTINVCTQLAGDENTTNDCMLKDVGVYSGSWSSGTTCPYWTYLGSGASYISSSVAPAYLFSIAGNTSSGQCTECYKYDVAADDWISIAPLPSGRYSLATAIVGDYLYAIGGLDINTFDPSSTVYKYDIVMDNWTTAASLPAALSYCKAVAYNNHIYVAGGYDGTSVFSSVYVYDVVSDTWTTATPLPATRAGGAFGITGNQIVYIGGLDFYGIYAEVFVGTIDGTDPTVINWTTMVNPYPGTKKETYSVKHGNILESILKKERPTNFIEATAYPSGAMWIFDAAPWGTDGIIVATGDPGNGYPAVPNPCYVYKPATDTWVRQGDVPIPVWGASLGSVNDGSTWKLIVAVGVSSSGYSDATQIYTDELEATTFVLNVNVSDGWNMVSAPGINPAGMEVDTWWPNNDPLYSVFKFNGIQYIAVDDATPGVGYWMYNSANETYSYPAIQIVAHDPIPVTINWNMIGGYEMSPTIVALKAANPQIIGSVFGYNGIQYVPATNLVPGYGYWVYVTNTNPIVIPDAMAKGNEEVEELFKEDWGRITLTDALGKSYTLYAVKGEVDLDQYRMPPLPPSGSFDIRFSSSRIAEDINETVKTIDMVGVTYPLTVRVEGMDIRLQDVTGKVLNQNLKSGEEIVIGDATIQKLMVSGELIPEVYALEQNYPNPFNPITTISYSIKEKGSVTLKVFDILGNEVASIVNTEMEAGKYQINFDASSFASGVYFYRLNAGEFNSTKKMVLLK